MQLPGGQHWSLVNPRCVHHELEGPRSRAPAAVHLGSQNTDSLPGICWSENVPKEETGSETAKTGGREEAAVREER